MNIKIGHAVIEPFARLEGGIQAAIGVQPCDALAGRPVEGSEVSPY